MKILKRVVIIILGLLLILWLAFTIFAEPVLKSTLSHALENHPQDSVSFKAIKLKFFPPGIKLKEAYLDLYLPTDSSLMHIKGEVKLASVGGIKWYKALAENEFDIGVINIKDGQLVWVASQKTDTLAQDTAKGKPLPPISVRKLHLTDILLTAPHDTTHVQLQLSAQLDEITIEKQDSLQWSIERIRLTSKEAQLENVVEDYLLGYDMLQFDSRDSTLTMADFSMTPILNRNQFVQKYGHRKVQPTVLLPHIAIAGVQIEKIKKGLVAQYIVIDSAEFEIYQDIRLERPDVRKPMPSELIATAPFMLDVDSLVLKNADLIYNHRPKQEDLGLASLTLSDIKLKAHPISNVGHTDCADLKLDISAVMENRPHLYLSATFFPDRTHHNFEVNLRMTETELGAFNEILYPTVGIKIKDGHCSEARVHMQGNDYGVQGYLDIAYTDLRVALPPTQEGELKFFKKAAESLGNFALVNNNNKMGDKRGNIAYQRPAKEPFVNFWWKGIQGGLLDVITPFYLNPDKD